MSSNVHKFQPAQDQALASQVRHLRTKVNELSKVVEDQAVQIKWLSIEPFDRAPQSSLTDMPSSFEFGKRIGTAVHFVARVFKFVITLIFKAIEFVAFLVTEIAKSPFENARRPPQAVRKPANSYVRSQTPRASQTRPVVQIPAPPSPNARWVWFGKWIDE